MNTYIYAARNGHLDCLKYAHENKCPWDTSRIYNSVGMNEKIKEYIKKKIQVIDYSEKFLLCKNC